MIPRRNGVEDAETSEKREDKIWRQIRTGNKSDYDSVRRDSRGFPIFVKGSNPSKENVAPHDGDAVFPSSSTLNKNASDRVDESRGTIDLPRGEATPGNSGQESSIAAFYSQLPREQAHLANECNRSAEIESVSIRPESAKYQPRSLSDWFIKRATAQLKQPIHVSKEMNSSSDLPIIDNHCAVCSMHLPQGIGADVWETHRLSIAHQVAVDGIVKSQDALASSARSIIKKSRKDHGSEHIGHIVLKPTNRGYTALERMGWHKGLGLGRSEWEYAKEEAERQISMMRKDPIVISDSDEEDDIDVEIEIGSERWLAMIHQGQARLEASRSAQKVQNEIIEADGIDGSSSAEQDKETVRVRPLLEPLSVQPRPDRRGIGKPMSSISKAQRQAKIASVGKVYQKDKVEEHLTKRQRVERDKQLMEEWKQLRNSLN